MSQGDLNEANIRIKRWLRAVEKMRRPDGRAFVINPGKPEVQTSALWPYASRWRVYERLKWSLDGTPDGKAIDTNACVAAASTAPDVVLKYTLWVQDEKRVAYFQDAHLRGKSRHDVPPDPPEFAEQRRMAAEAAAAAGEHTTEWVKRSARGQMAHAGFDDPVKFELAWQEAVARGLVRG